jgi:hypothetical chaperone protein
MQSMTYCAIDFGTSNSAVALPAGDAVRLAPVEDSHETLPTAVFFNTDEDAILYGRAAMAAYIDGFDGRLMRSLKSILGSSLAEGTTELGDGTAVKYTDVIAIFLTYLKDRAQACAQEPINRAVLGRPVFFVDGDPRADLLAQQQLEAAARRTSRSYASVPIGCAASTARKTYWPITACMWRAPISTAGSSWRRF